MNTNHLTNKDDDIDRLLASIARAGRTTTAVEAQEAQARAYKLTMPTIPTREQADAEGCYIPAFVPAILLTQGVMMPPVEGVEFPVEPNDIHLEAYNLLPAFVRDYGDKYITGGYKIRPASILKMWIQALESKAKNDTVGQLIFPWELRLVVQEMANPTDGRPPQMFNPKNMVAVAVQLRLRSYENGTPGFADAQDEYLHRVPTSSYKPYKHVGLAHEKQTVRAVSSTYWTDLTGYPNDFGNVSVSREAIMLINSLVRIRQAEDKLTTPMALLLTTNMMRAVTCRLRANLPLHPQKVVDLAYRYSTTHLRKYAK